LCNEKGLPELLAALADESMRGLAWHLDLAGAGDGQRYAELAARYGISERMKFWGQVDEVHVQRLMAEADVFVLPSHYEAISIAMLEAMAHCCAIVATPVGDTLDVVTDGGSALLVPPGDVAALAAGLRRVTTDPALRVSLQQSARRRFCANFEIGSHCQRLAELYTEIVPRLADRRQTHVHPSTGSG
jgi:glycosyltransferase involved in cell wall biosynthesis